MCPLRVLLSCPLRVLLLWALLCPCTGKIQEIFTRPGSDLLLPIRRHLTLNTEDRWRCDWIIWHYLESPGDWKRIAYHRNCDPSDLRYFPNTRISENGSLIISNVTPENDGIYRVYIKNSTGRRIQRDDYIVHVEGKAQEIFTRPGSDLLIPIRIHLTLNHTDTERCDWFIWYYEKFPGVWGTIAQHWNCDPFDRRYFPNTRISENGSLIISNVTPENDGIYNVYIYNSTGPLIQRDDYFIHVEVPLSDIAVTSSCLPDGSAEAECSVKGSDPRYSWSLDGRSVSSHRRVTLPPPVSGTLHCDVTNQINNLSRSINISCPVPVSDPVLDVRCLQNDSAEISCWVEIGTDPSIYLTVSGGLEVYDVTSSERTVRVTVPPVSPPDSWNIRCSAKNNISERSTNQTQDACPDDASAPDKWDSPKKRVEP
ncbi:cell adhesion molecule CEACAM2-like isoform X3 [Lithobates pipiens]